MNFGAGLSPLPKPALADRKSLSRGYIDGRWPAAAGRSPTAWPKQAYASTQAFCGQENPYSEGISPACACSDGVDAARAVDAGPCRQYTLWITISSALEACLDGVDSLKRAHAVDIPSR